MSKITRNSFSKKLVKYGALSLAIAGVADATGQIIYTDVDPDFVGGSGDSFFLDFDVDAVDDIVVNQFYNVSYELLQAVPTGANGVLAQSAGGFFYASNLSYGAAISAGAGSFRSFGDFCAGGGYAGSQHCGAGEGYLGVEFDISGNTHYGWVRVDVADSSNFIILDYAYEATPDTKILAGNILSVGDFDPSNFKYFVDVNSQLNIKASVPMTNVAIHNVLGQQVVSQKLANTNEVVDLASFTTGVYFVTVTIDDNSKSFKIIKR